jgi:hypothetical protein
MEQPEIALRPKKGRKLKIPDQDRKERKRRSNNNEEFIDFKGEVKRPKVFKNVSKCCKKKCFESLKADQQERIFELFYKLGSFERRATFFAYNVREITSKGISRKTGGMTEVRAYHLNGLRVCSRFFFDVLQVDSSRCYTALDKFKNFDLRDLRGYSPKPKLSSEQKQFAIDFFTAIPRHVSHYNNERTNACYLGSEWDEAKLYRAYEDKWKEANSVIAPMSPTSFDNIFKKFNIKFHPRTIDGCRACDTFLARSKLGENVTEAHNHHLDQARKLRASLNADLVLAENDPTVETITMDYEKTHIYPNLPTSIVYYLRKLSLINFGIHRAKNKKAYFFPYLETEGGRGPEEVGSCLKIFIEMHIKAPVKILRIYCDCCGGQNRNFKLCVILAKILSQHPSLETIEIRFLESGHSYLPNDRDFGDFQRLVNKQERIELLTHYIRLMKECRVDAETIDVTPMDHTKFIDWEPLKSIVCHRKKSTTKEDWKMMKVHQIRIIKNQPSKLFLKYDLTQADVSLKTQNF